MVTGADILDLAREHIGEQYILGARAPMANSDWRGPWDCAEFCSWCVYQATGLLYGVRPNDDPIRADAYSGFWGDDAETMGSIISVEDAMNTVGACILREPMTGRSGHIAFSDGAGGSVEAHSKNRGVIAHTAQRRRWDYGILVPGVIYFRNDSEVVYKRPKVSVLKVTDPLTAGPRVAALQRELDQRGYPVGAIDGVYGNQTEAAVMAFQNDEGIVVDGEAGKKTLSLLGLLDDD